MEVNIRIGEDSVFWSLRRESNGVVSINKNSYMVMYCNEGVPESYDLADTLIEEIGSQITEELKKILGSKLPPKLKIEVVEQY